MKLIMRSLRALCMIIAMHAGVQTSSAGGDDNPIDEVGMVQLVPGASIAAFNAAYGTTTLASYAPQNLHRVGLPASIPADQFEALVAPDPNVLFADRIYPVTDANPEGSTQSFFFYEAPERFWEQPAIYPLRLGDRPSAVQGQGVIVAVIDTGIASHPLFTGDLLTGYNFVDNNTNTTDAPDFIDNNQNGAVDEFAGHGTIAAGLVQRVAPHVALLPVKVMDSDGQSDTYRLAAGMHYALDEGAHVVSVSMGTIDPADILAAAVQRAASLNVIIVAAAGNDDQPEPRRYPAGFINPAVVAVAAVDDLDVRAVFSSYGAHVTLTAPGVAVTSLAPGDGFGTASGTSVSAPLAAGAASLVVQVAVPAAPITTKKLLASACDPVDASNPGFEGLLGAGRLDVANSVYRAMHARYTAGCAGPPGQSVAGTCGPLDLDGDFDVDMCDFAMIQAGID